MNNDVQGSLNTGGDQYGQTRNPQSIGGQNLVAPESNLQSAAGSLFTQPGLKISSVGGLNINTTNPSTSTISKASNTSYFSPTPYIAGVIVILLAFALVIVYVIKKGHVVPNS